MPFRLASGDRLRVPAIVVSEGTQSLLCDVFGRRDLFRDLPRIERRIVAWGRGAAAVELPHSAVVISEEELASRLEAQAPPQAGEWTVHASAPLPEGVVMHDFGSRMAAAVAVESAGGACWVESLERGWLFLIPGWLIAVGGGPEELLPESRVVAAQVREIRGAAQSFRAWPRIADPLCGPRWLACGSAAMAFDPICGDGTGNAVREAILAAAVIRAAARGESEERLLAHYRARLIAAFRRHLELSLAFYRAGDGGAWWDGEIGAMERGIAWCREREGRFWYRLNGFELERIDA